jgi:hypothetical protein
MKSVRLRKTVNENRQQAQAKQAMGGRVRVYARDNPHDKAMIAELQSKLNKIKIEHAARGRVLKDREHLLVEKKQQYNLLRDDHCSMCMKYQALQKRGVSSGGSGGSNRLQTTIAGLKTELRSHKDTIAELQSRLQEQEECEDEGEDPEVNDDDDDEVMVVDEEEEVEADETSMDEMCREESESVRADEELERQVKNLTQQLMQAQHGNQMACRETQAKEQECNKLRGKLMQLQMQHGAGSSKELEVAKRESAELAIKFEAALDALKLCEEQFVTRISALERELRASREGVEHVKEMEIRVKEGEQQRKQQREQAQQLDQEQQQQMLKLSQQVHALQRELMAALARQGNNTGLLQPPEKQSARFSCCGSDTSGMEAEHERTLAESAAQIAALYEELESAREELVKATEKLAALDMQTSAALKSLEDDAARAKAAAATAQAERAVAVVAEAEATSALAAADSRMKAVATEATVAAEARIQTQWQDTLLQRDAEHREEVRAWAKRRAKVQEDAEYRSREQKRDCERREGVLEAELDRLQGRVEAAESAEAEARKAAADAHTAL